MDGVFYILVAALIVLGVFLLGREITCWYFKINAMAATLDRLDQHLVKIHVALTKKQVQP